MERLTKRWGNNPAVPATFYIDFVFEMDGVQAAAFKDFCNRLADYEDTGLEPQEITALKLYAMGAAVAEIQEFDGVSICRLQELAKAEKEGRLAIVPAPGDVLYETDPAHGVVKHTVTDVYWGANTNAVDDNGQTWADYYTNEDIETAHTTREAAEAVLAAGSIMEGRA